MGDTQYGPKVDVWAIGCVFVELVKVTKLLFFKFRFNIVSNNVSNNYVETVLK